MKSGIKNFLLYLPAIMLAGMLISGCGGGYKETDIDSPTRGSITVGIDESYSLLADAELDVFQILYPNAKVDTFCRNEVDVIDAFMHDSLQLIIVSRKLTNEEEALLKTQQIYPKTTQIAYDAIAIIVNRQNPDSLMYYDKIEAMFKGQVTDWKQMNPKSDLKELKVVFDNYKSGNTRYFREKFNIEKLPSTCFALSDNAEVIDFVQNNKGAIGIISVNWVSNKADTVSHTFLNKVRVVGVSRPGNNDPETDFYTPHPGYIAEGNYPFTRGVYCLNRQTYHGLAYGISSFIAGVKGQLIVLRSGMVPASMPVRLVEVKN